MHRLILLLPFLASAVVAQPTWVRMPDSPESGTRSEDIWFISADLGWSVGGNGVVHRTEDGGDSWAETASTGAFVRAVTFANSTHGWIGTLNYGDGAQLYETQDSGDTFTDITDRLPETVEGICSLFAVSENVIYGAGVYYGPAQLLKTSDGGTTWTVRSLQPHLDTVIDVYFFDELRGVAVGGTGTFSDVIHPRVIETTDGGNTWTVRHTVTSVSRGWGWKLSFPTPEIGYMSIEKYNSSNDAMVLKTVDGGVTWTELTIPDARGGNMQGIGFVTPDVGWTGGRGRTSVTMDGGATWAELPFSEGLDGTINRFRFVDGVGFAVGRWIHRLDMREVATEVGPAGSPLLLSLNPNPARSVVRVRYQPSAGSATVDVFDTLGRRVDRLNEPVADGQAEWQIPAGLADGVYTIRIRTSDSEDAATVAVVR